MNTNRIEWIGVADVAAELGLSDRQAWELVRRLGVPMLDAGRAVMKSARFRRSDWEAARDAGLKAPPPRARRPGAAEGPKRPPEKKGPGGRLSKLRGA